MTTLREAAQQALEALEQARDTTYSDTLYAKFEVAITALRAALEQPEQEPVAWMVYTEDGKSAYVTDNPHDLVGAYKAFALYAYPPRREWRGLTEEEVDQMARDTVDAWECTRAVEAKLKELNHHE